MGGFQTRDELLRFSRQMEMAAFQGIVGSTVQPSGYLMQFPALAVLALTHGATTN